MWWESKTDKFLTGNDDFLISTVFVFVFISCHCLYCTMCRFHCWHCHLEKDWLSFVRSSFLLPSKTVFTYSHFCVSSLLFQSIVFVCFANVPFPNVLNRFHVLRVFQCLLNRNSITPTEKDTLLLRERTLEKHWTNYAKCKNIIFKTSSSTPTESSKKKGEHASVILLQLEQHLREHRKQSSETYRPGIEINIVRLECYKNICKIHFPSL